MLYPFVEEEECEWYTCVYVLYSFLKEEKCEWYTCVYVLYPFVEERECKWHTLLCLVPIHEGRRVQMVYTCDICINVCTTHYLSVMIELLFIVCHKNTICDWCSHMNLIPWYMSIYVCEKCYMSVLLGDRCIPRCINWYLKMYDWYQCTTMSIGR